VILVWIFAVVSLGKQFDALTARDAKLNIPDPPSSRPQSQLMKEGA
jgi:hypothetical protein